MTSRPRVVPLHAEHYNPLLLWVQVLAGTALAVVLFWSLRLALGLRAASLQREAAKRQEAARGRVVVAELPRDDGSVELFLEDEARFYWGGASVAKSHLLGARLLLNEGVVASEARDGVSLPEPAEAEEYEGRERWEVRLYARDAGALSVACGRLREGVSHGVARDVFAAARRVLRVPGGEP